MRVDNGKTRRPTGVEGQGERAQGSHRNLGDLTVSLQETGAVEGRNPNASGLAIERAAPRESEQPAQRGIATDTTTKGRETNGEESERRVVALKQGHYPEGPCGAKGAPDRGTVGGQDGRDTELGKRLNETATDSRARSQDA